MEYDLRGPNMSIVRLCDGQSLDRRGLADDQFDDADCFVAGGTEATITELGVGGFSAMRALSLRNDEPERASRPFDKDRDGLLWAKVPVWSFLKKSNAKSVVREFIVSFPAMD